MRFPRRRLLRVSLRWQQQESFDAGRELFVTCVLQKPEYRDTPICDRLVVYDKPEDALGTLTDGDVNVRYVRMVMVATNQQLRRVLEPGQELCHPDAAPYLRAHLTCPLYYLRWEETKHGLNMEIVPPLPQSGTRQAMIGILRPADATTPWWGE